MSRIFIFLLLLLSYQIVVSQKIDTLNLEVRLGAENLELRRKVWIEELKDSIQITKFQVYISKPFHKKRRFQPDFVFWDYTLSSNLQFLIQPRKLASFIKIGVDSTTNLKCRFTGSLDPSKGMYWTWQNGFIHLKLEGIGNLVSTPYHIFQFHLGGYSFPNNCVGEVALGNGGGNKTLVINIQPMLQKAYEDQLFEVLSPGKKTNEFMKRFVDSIQVIK